MTPAPQADKLTLVRRVTLDLTGLPPTPEQVDAFVADQSPDAYERLIERLLAKLGRKPLDHVVVNLQRFFFEPESYGQTR